LEPWQIVWVQLRMRNALISKRYLKGPHNGGVMLIP
jgi:hypothetical protein